MPCLLELRLKNVSETQKVGTCLGGLLFPGAVLGLIGPLGAGKTLLARAIAAGLGTPDPRLVTSPTFVLIQEYQGRLPIYHFDVYRLKQASDFTALGADEYLEGRGVCLIEWADRVSGSLPDDRLDVTLTALGESSREARFQALGPRHGAILADLGKALATITRRDPDNP